MITYLKSCLVLLLLLVVSVVPATAGVVQVGSAADAQVVEGSPTQNYGSENALNVASAAGGTYQGEHAWVKFDLTGQIPPGATIHSATLRLWCWRSDTADDMTADVHGSTDDTWTEGGITWNNQPAYGAQVASQPMTANYEDYWVEWDVTGVVQTEVSGDRVVSLVVKPAVEGQDPSTSRTRSLRCAPPKAATW